MIYEDNKNITINNECECKETNDTCSQGISDLLDFEKECASYAYSEESTVEFAKRMYDLGAKSNQDTIGLLESRVETLQQVIGWKTQANHDLTTKYLKEIRGVKADYEERTDFQAKIIANLRRQFCEAIKQRDDLQKELDKLDYLDQHIDILDRATERLSKLEFVLIGSK